MTDRDHWGGREGGREGRGQRYRKVWTKSGFSAVRRVVGRAIISSSALYTCFVTGACLTGDDGVTYTRPVWLLGRRLEPSASVGLTEGGRGQVASRRQKRTLGALSTLSVDAFLQFH